MVEQFGLAMILSSGVRVSAFSSGTTSFLVGSMRQAEELSITVVPTAAKRGACSLLTEPPAEKMAMSGRAAMASSMLTTGYFLPLKFNKLAHRFGRSHGQQLGEGKPALGQHFQ